MKQIFSRREALSLGAAALATPVLGRSAEAGASPVLIELFTSQGCSSCPAADKLAGQLRKDSKLVVVSLNVDYWDYLGWKDTLAKPEYTKRQMDYAHARGDGDVYTPQMVINGQRHAVGSRRSDVEAAINKVRPASAPVSISSKGKEIVVEVGAGASADATLWLMSVAPEISVAIERGENSGTTVTYHNVVRMLSPIGMWKGDAMKLTLPRASLTTQDCKSCIAVLQDGSVGRVLGLAQHSFSST